MMTYLGLHHDGQSWAVVDDHGAVIARTDEIPPDEGRRAWAWGRGIHAGTPGIAVPLETTYVDDGKARPCPSVFHDGTGWVMTDAQGTVVARNDEIPADGDYTGWTDRILRSRPSHAPAV